MYLTPADRPVLVTHDATAGTLTVVWFRPAVEPLIVYDVSVPHANPPGVCWRETWGVREGTLGLLAREPGVHRVGHWVAEEFFFPEDP